MTAPEIPPEIRSMFSAQELREIARYTIRLADGVERDVVRLAIAWDAHVRKIDADRALPWSDRTVWTEHDLVAALILRDYTEEALRRLPASLADRARRYVGIADELFGSFTVADPGDLLARIAGVDLTGRSWWWFRIPGSGPIAQDLASYRR